MKHIVTAGGIIVKGKKILLIRHERGGFTFSKGHVEGNESLEEAALREVSEETAYEAVIIAYLGNLERLSSEEIGEQVIKKVELYRMAYTAKLNNEPEEIPVWVQPNEAIDHMQFIEEANFLKQHLKDLALSE